MLRIPEDHSLILTEYICPECDNEFYVAQEHGLLTCPREFCGARHIQPNGDKAIYSKKYKYDPE